MIERLKEFIESQNISVSAFEQRIGASDGMIRRAIKKGTDIQSKWLALISDNFHDLSLEWLISGKGSMLKSIPEEYVAAKSDTDQVSEPEMTIRRLKTDYFGVDRQFIPLYEIEASAGLNTIFSSDNTQIPLDYISVPNAPKCDGALFARGDSMYPLLKAGDIVCYKTIHNIDNIIFGEMYVLDLDNGDDQFLTVKYVQKSDKGRKFVKLVSENRHHADKEEPVKNVRALGIVKITIRYNTLS